MIGKMIRLLISVTISLAVQGSIICCADQNLTGTAITTFAQGYLEKQLTEKYEKENIEIFSTRPIPDLKLSDGKITMAMDEKEIACIGKYYTLPIIISCNDKQLKTLYVNFKVKLYETAVVAARTLKMHHIISSDDLTTARVEITNTSDTCKDTAELVGQKTSQYVQSGKAICYTSIEKAPIVAKNKQLKVIGRIGDIEATTYGTAMENGFKDDIIKIQNPSSQKIISAKIIDKNTAELVF